MTQNELTELLGWMSVINISILLISTLSIIAMRNTITNIHSKLFGLEQNDLIKSYFQYLAHFKMTVIIFNIAPYVALKIMA